MVIVVPEGDEEDATRKLGYYDEAFEYFNKNYICQFYDKYTKLQNLNR